MPRPGIEPNFVCLSSDVCRNINEDKRKAEAHQVMFEIVNDIENCPVCSLFVDRNFKLFAV